MKLFECMQSEGGLVDSYDGFRHFEIKIKLMFFTNGLFPMISMRIKMNDCENR